MHPLARRNSVCGKIITLNTEVDVKADLPFGIVAPSVPSAHTLVGLEAAHGQLCIPPPVHGALIDVG